MNKLLIVLMFISSVAAYGQIEVEATHTQLIHHYDFALQTDLIRKNLTRPTKGLKVFLRDEESYNAVAIFLGRDCLGGRIQGITYHKGLSINLSRVMGLDVGFMVGGYNFKKEVWDRAGVEQISIANTIIPLAGLDLNLKFKVSDNIRINLNNTITPVLSIHSVTLSLEF